MRNFLRRLVLVAVLVGGLYAVAYGQTPTPTPFSLNPIPQLNSSFLTRLQEYLWREDGGRRILGEGDYVASGCIHDTAIGKSATFSGSCRVFLAELMYSQTLGTIDYDALGADDNDTVWVAIAAASPGGNFVQNGSTLIWVDFADSSKPDLPGAQTGRGNGYIWAMEVTIAGGSITRVIDIRPRNPNVHLVQSLSEIDATSTSPGDLFFNAAPLGSPTPTPGRLAYYSGVGSTIAQVPYADSSGCSTCGGSASGFFSSGQIEPARGGTGDDTSGTTGVPYIVAGNWLSESARAPVRGGTGDDTSGTTGVPYITAGNWQYETTLDSARGGTDVDMSAASGFVGWASGTPTSRPFPAWHSRVLIDAVGVDGTNCTHVANQATIVTGVLAPAIRCVDNNGSILTFSLELPTFYTAGSDLEITLTVVNNTTSSGNVAFAWQIACIGDGETLSAASYGSPTTGTSTLAGTIGNTDKTVVTVTPGNSPQPGDSCFFTATMSESSTTFGGTLETDVSFTSILVSAPTVSSLTH